MRILHILGRITSKKSTYAIWLNGIKGQQCVDNINIVDCVFSGVEHENQIKNSGRATLENVIMNGKPLLQNL